MPVLKGSNIDPNMVDSPLDRIEACDGKIKEQASIVGEQLDKWKSFKSTRAGQIVGDLADPQIQHLQNRICGGVEVTRRYFDAQGMVATSEDMKAYLDECRGALGVWKDIKYRQQILERTMDEINKQIEKEEKRAKEVPKNIQEYL